MDETERRAHLLMWVRALPHDVDQKPAGMVKLVRHLVADMDALVKLLDGPENAENEKSKFSQPGRQRVDESLYVEALDELLVLFNLYEQSDSATSYVSNYNAVERSLDLIAAYRRVHPEHKITLSLYQHLQKTGRL